MSKLNKSMDTYEIGDRVYFWKQMTRDIFDFEGTEMEVESGEIKDIIAAKLSKDVLYKIEVEVSKKYTVNFIVKHVTKKMQDIPFIHPDIVNFYKTYKDAKI